MTTFGTDDEFLKKFFSRIPEATAASYTEEQLAGVKMAFGGRSRGRHALNFRRSLPLFGRHFYLVCMLGWERRTSHRTAASHRRRDLRHLANAIAIVAFFGIILLAILGGLYGMKIVLGIDVFPSVDMLPDGAIQSPFR